MNPTKKIMCGAIYNMDDKVYITQMESAYNIIEDTNKQLDDKAMKMITLISAMLALQVNFFLPSINNMVKWVLCLFILACYFGSLICFIKPTILKKFKYYPNMEFIKKCYEYNYSEEEYVSESLGAYENTINHNLSLLNSKSKDLQYGFYCFIGSIILSILILVTYIV